MRSLLPSIALLNRLFVLLFVLSVSALARAVFTAAAATA